MNRISSLLLILLVLSAMACTASAENLNVRPISTDDGSAVPIDNGGTYCTGATLIDAATTHYVDLGFLDMDNDCSNPYPWPYNEVFYKFMPAVSRTYIFRLQMFHPSTSVGLRIMANACCAGGSTVAFDTTMVAADCDSAATAYLRADLNSSTWYWFHIGDMSLTTHASAYRFEMMYVPCPNIESPIPHRTPATAEVIALNDSVMGDSATFGHSSWYKFTVPNSDSVIISEYGRSFGHCISGFYPLCFTNPLDAHFFVYCDSLGHVLYESHGELCSTDAQAKLCLPAGIYYIQVVNYGGDSWLGWNYILSVITRPGGNCPPLPAYCGQDIFLCPTGYDSLVTLVPNNLPFPAPQHVEACVRLDTAHVTTLVVPVGNFHNLPVVTVSTQCSTCTANGCQMLIGTWSYNPNGWQFFNGPPRYVNHIMANQGAHGCCVCVSLDFVLPVELMNFTAIAGDGEVTLNWSTASENNNDHFEIERAGTPVATIRGAGTSSERHNYHYTDPSLINGRVYTYNLVSVDGNGNRSTTGTVSAKPQGGASLVTEYTLRQNYPNPFNPTTSIGFDLVESGSANLTVYNLMGRQVAVLVNGNLSAGRHEVNFDAASFPSGIYLYRLQVNGFVAEKKMLLLK